MYSSTHICLCISNSWRFQFFWNTYYSICPADHQSVPPFNCFLVYEWQMGFLLVNWKKKRRMSICLNIHQTGILAWLANICQSLHKHICICRALYEARKKYVHYRFDEKLTRTGWEHNNSSNGGNQNNPDIVGRVVMVN